MKAKNVEFRYYEIPDGELCLPLTGPAWHKAYGEGPERLHFHNYFELGICYEGIGEMTLGEDTIHFRAGCVSVIPPSVLHTTNTRPGTRARWEWLYFDLSYVLELMFPNQKILQNRRKEELYRKAMLFEPSETTGRLYMFLERMLSETREKKILYQDMIRNLLCAFIIELMRLEKTCFPFGQDRERSMGIEPALDYVNEHYAAEIRIPDLAVCCGMSESYFRKKFGSYMNMKPAEYINYIRIDKSCILLRNTNYSLQEISIQVGFESPSSFIRNFKKIVGKTPHQWKLGEQEMEARYKITAMPGWMK